MAPQSWHPQVCVVQDCCCVEPLVKLSGRERDTFLRTVNIRSIPLIRPPPALALRRRSVDVPAGRLMVAEAVAQIPGGSVIDTPKNHQRRELVVPRFVAALLQEHLATVDEDPEAFLFPGRQGHTINRQRSYYGFRSRFIVAAMAAGLVDITPHDLRRVRGSGTQRARKIEKHP